MAESLGLCHGSETRQPALRRGTRERRDKGGGGCSEIFRHLYGSEIRCGMVSRRRPARSSSVYPIGVSASSKAAEAPGFCSSRDCARRA